MKIIHVTPFYFPAWEFGGPPRVAYSFCETLSKMGHDVSVITTNNLNLKGDRKILVKRNAVTIKNHKVYYFRSVINLGKFFVTPSLLFEGANILKDANIIHLHGFRTFQNIIISFLSKHLGRKYVIQTHGSIPIFYDKWLLKHIYDTFFGKRILHQASMILALNYTEQKILQEVLRIPEEKISIIPNTISLEWYQKYLDKIHPNSFREKYGIKDDEQIILYVGRLHKSKGLDFLIKSFWLLKKKFGIKNIKLLLIGPDDGFLHQLVELVSSLGLQKDVLFVGFLSETEKAMAYFDSNIFVTPKYTGFPTTFLEACFFGLPIITTEKSDKLDLFNNNVGIITRFDVESFASAIAELILNDALSYSIKKECKRIIRRYDTRIVTMKLLNIYRHVLAD